MRFPKPGWVVPRLLRITLTAVCVLLVLMALTGGYAFASPNGNGNQGGNGGDGGIAPEISLGSMAGGVALLTGSMLLLAGRRRRE